MTWRKVTLVATWDGKVQTVDRLMKKGTKKQKKMFEEGNAIVFDGEIDGKGNYRSLESPEENYGKYLR